MVPRGIIFPLVSRAMDAAADRKLPAVNSSLLASKDFSRATVRSLSKKGVTIVGATMLPDANGGFANGEVGYALLIDRTHCVRTFREVLALAV